MVASTPSLVRDSLDKTVRSWTSTQNLATLNNDNNAVEVTPPLRLRQRPSSWSSTPDLDEAQKAPVKSVEEVTVSVQLPARRRHTTKNVDAIEESFTMKRPPPSPNHVPATLPPKQQTSAEPAEEAIIIHKTDSLAERVRKMQMMKRQGSLERELGREGSVPKSDSEQPKPVKRQEPDTKIISRRRQTDPLPPIPDEKPPTPVRISRASDLPPIPDARPPRSRSEHPPVKESKTKSSTNKKPPPVVRTSSDSYKSNNKDVQFLIQIKDNKMASSSNRQDDDMSTITDTTETTLVDCKEGDLKEELEMMKRDLEAMKARCERAERDKSDILLRRLASMDTTSNRTTASENLKLQQKVNEMKQKLEEIQDEKKSLTLKVKELSNELNDRPSKTIEEALRSKLDQAERMCEALMDENEDMKRELKNMESEIDEMQDNFREEQADEYVSVKKELEQTNKNCRILSFKLKKSERRIEQFEMEKQAQGSNQSNTDLITKIKQLEDELKVANEVARRLQAESENSTTLKKKPPTLGKIGKSTSDGGKVSRETLTRGGSQEDPVQLLRDLQDSIEREADLREQLKFAEEEVSSDKVVSNFSYHSNSRITFSFLVNIVKRKILQSATLK